MALLGTLFLIGLTAACLQALGAEICLVHRLTGWPCLTCGSSRAVARLLAGDVAGAFRLQPLVTALALCAIPAGLLCALARSGLRCVPEVSLTPAERRTAWVAGIGLLLLNWAYLVWRGI
jgi:hypothetical protein